jgi:hypothetical protein
MRFTCREYGFRDWPRTLLSYHRVFEPGQLPAGPIRLVDDETGQHKSVQTHRPTFHEDGSYDSAWVCFFAELEKNGSFAYTLEPGDPETHDTYHLTIGSSPDGKWLEARNTWTGFRAPRPGDIEVPDAWATMPKPRQYTQYKDWLDAGEIAPGPVQGILLDDGRWIGYSHWILAHPTLSPKMARITTEVTGDGPLFYEVKVRYDFTNGGWSNHFLRLTCEDLYTQYVQDADLNAPEGYWGGAVRFSFAGAENGFSPDKYYWHSTPNAMKQKDPAFESAMTALGYDVSRPRYRDTPYIGSGSLDYAGPTRSLGDIRSWSPWRKGLHYVGFVESEKLDPAATQIPHFAIVPQHAGDWRAAHGRRPPLFPIALIQDTGVHCAMVAGPDRYPNDSGEHDPSEGMERTSLSCLFVAGAFDWHDGLKPLRHHDGYVNLDDYKDWILEWPKDIPDQHPRFGTDPKRFREWAESGEFDQHPLWAPHFKDYVSTEETPEAVGARETLLLKDTSQWNYGHTGWGWVVKQLNEIHNRADAGRLTWVSHYRQSQFCDWMRIVDDYLASKEHHDPEKRKLIRAHTAAFMNLMATPDFNPRGASIHTGNPNMPINKFFALMYGAYVLGEHPDSKKWIEHAIQVLRYRASRMVCPGGAWAESITYFHASAGTLVNAAWIMRKMVGLSRRDPVYKQMESLARFALTVAAPPDPRFRGARVPPNWGHEGPGLLRSWFVQAANLFNGLDDRLASALAWVWQTQGKPVRDGHDDGFSVNASLQAERLLDPTGLSPAGVGRYFRSAWLPGFGATLHSHDGQDQELYMSLSNGYALSHRDANQGDFVLYGRGVPISTISLDQYGLNRGQLKKSHNEHGWHNRPRFGARNTPGTTWSGGNSQVFAHHFGEVCHYARSQYNWGNEVHDRQYLLVRGPDVKDPAYVFIGDSFTPKPGKTSDDLLTKYWTFRTLGDASTLEEVWDNGLLYQSHLDPEVKFHLRLHGRVSDGVETREVTSNPTLPGPHAKMWHLNPTGRPIRVKDTHNVHSFGPIEAGKDVVAVLQPTRGDEEPVTTQRMGPGVYRVAYRDSQAKPVTDYLFFTPPGRRPVGAQYCMDWEGKREKVRFQGTAGLVRFAQNKVWLSILEGPGRIEVANFVLESDDPATRGFDRADFRGNDRVTIEPSPSQWGARMEEFLTAEPDPDDEVEIIDHAPGVQEWRKGPTRRFAINLEEEVDWMAEFGLFDFRGRKALVLANEETLDLHLFMFEGEKLIWRGWPKEIGRWGWGVFEGRGFWQLHYNYSGIQGYHEGPGRFLWLTAPIQKGLGSKTTRGPRGQVTYRVKGVPGLVPQGYGPHTNPLMTVPLLEGRHRFLLNAYKQPEVIRSRRKEIFT